ncbi:unnamed protein product, partial [Prorocentrum cordatum]
DNSDTDASTDTEELYCDKNGNPITLPSAMEEFKTYVTRRRPEPMLMALNKQDNFNLVDFVYFGPPAQQTVGDLVHHVDDTEISFNREEPVAECALLWRTANLEVRTTQPVPEGYGPVNFQSKAKPSSRVSKRDLHNLTAGDQRQHHNHVINSMGRELQQWLEWESVGIVLKRGAKNRADVIWVFRWKITVNDDKGQRDVKGRWTEVSKIGNH